MSRPPLEPSPGPWDSQDFFHQGRSTAEDAPDATLLPAAYPRIVILSRAPLLSEGLRRLLSGAGAHDVSAADPLDVHLGEGPCVVLVEGQTVDQALALLGNASLRRGGGYAVLVVDDADPDEVARAIRQGVIRACLAKRLAGAGLLAALRLVADGQVVVPAEVVERLQKPQIRLAAAVVPSAHGLSLQELKVLQHLAEGTPTKVIARRMSITAATVTTHIKRILQKLGLRNRTQAGIWAALNSSILDK